MRKCTVDPKCLLEVFIGRYHKVVLLGVSLPALRLYDNKKSYE